MRSPTRRACSTRFSSTIVSTVTRAAAAASGLPPYDDELPLGLAHGFEKASSSRAITPLIGKPPPNPFPTVRMSGRTPSCSIANILPVRPNPVIISSQISRAPSSSASSRNSCK